MAAKDVIFGGEARARMVEGEDLVVMREEDVMAIIEGK